MHKPDNLLFTMARMQKSVHRAIVSAGTGTHLRLVLRCLRGFLLFSRRYSVPAIVTSAAVWVSWRARWMKDREEMRRDDSKSEGGWAGDGAWRHTSDFPCLHPDFFCVCHRTLGIFTRSFVPPDHLQCAVPSDGVISVTFIFKHKFLWFHYSSMMLSLLYLYFQGEKR